MKLLSKTITRRLKSRHFFFSAVFFIQLTIHSWAPWGYILFKEPLKRHSRYNDFRRQWISEISNCYRKTVQSWEQVNTNRETTEITDPLYGFLLCLCWTHTELPENCSFCFSVVHNSTLDKISEILEIQLTFISARRAKDCCRSPLLVAFKIPDSGFTACLVYPINVPFLSSIRIYFV